MSNYMPLRILCIAGLALAAASPAVAQSSTRGGQEPSAVRPEPRYEVLPTARDPFFARRTEPKVSANDPEAEPVVPPGAAPAEEIRARARLSGLLGAQAGSNVASAAIINGNIYRVGEALKLTIQNDTEKIIVKDLFLNPPRVVLTYKGEEITLSLNKQKEND